MINYWNEAGISVQCINLSCTKRSQSRCRYASLNVLSSALLLCGWMFGLRVQWVPDLHARVLQTETGTGFVHVSPCHTNAAVSVLWQDCGFPQFFIKGLTSIQSIVSEPKSYMEPLIESLEYMAHVSEVVLIHWAADSVSQDRQDKVCLTVR